MLKNNIDRIATVVGLAAVIGAASTSAHATPTFYVGYDTTASTFTQLTSNAGPPGVPGTLTAQSALLSHAPTTAVVQKYDFGNLTPSTSTTGGSVKNGFTALNGELAVSFTNETSANLYGVPIASLSGQGSNNVPGGGTSETLGFGTVSTNSPYVLVQGGSGVGDVTFTFLTPVTSFGFFITGIGNAGTAPVVVNFNDGTARTYSLNGSSATAGAFGSTTNNYTKTATSTGGAEFFGFTDTNPVSSITLAQTTGSGDRYSFDNFSFTVVPEPSTWSISITGVAGLLGLLFLKRKKSLFSQ